MIYLKLQLAHSTHTLQTHSMLSVLDYCDSRLAKSALRQTRQTVYFRGVQLFYFRRASNRGLSIGTFVLPWVSLDVHSFPIRKAVLHILTGAWSVGRKRRFMAVCLTRWIGLPVITSPVRTLTGPTIYLDISVNRLSRLYLALSRWSVVLVLGLRVIVVSQLNLTSRRFWCEDQSRQNGSRMIYPPPKLESVSVINVVSNGKVTVVVCRQICGVKRSVYTAKVNHFLWCERSRWILGAWERGGSEEGAEARMFLFYFIYSLLFLCAFSADISMCKQRSL